MILVDTSVWIDHLRSKDPRLVKLLEDDLVLVHPWVKGELDLGLIKDREKFFKFLGYLTELRPVKDAEVLAFIESNSLAGRGIGWVDAGLLAACQARSCSIWSRDKRLVAIARELGLAEAVI